MNEQPTPKELIAWTKEFYATPFAKYFIATFKEQQQMYLGIAMKSGDINEKALAAERAAGVGEPIEWIESLLAVANDPERMKELIEEEATEPEKV